MAEFITVMREYNRMCNSDMGCDNCQVSASNNGTGASCYHFIRKSPEKAERIIMSWASEHPILTNRKKFEEVFGFALDERCAMPITILDWLDEEYRETE